MTTRAALATIALIGLSACATAGSAPAGPAPTADTIRFSAGPCFGFCPSYSVTVEPNGSAMLTPKRNTAVPGETRFTVTPQQYRRLRAAFAPFRPVTGTAKRIAPGENCDRVATDHPSYTIEWLRRGMKDTKLDYYSGCHDARYAKLRPVVASVPKLLEIEAMLKPANPTR